MAREFMWGPFTLARVDEDKAKDTPTDYVFAIDISGNKATFILSRRAFNFWWNSGGEVGRPSRHEHVTAVTLHLWPLRFSWFSEWVNFDS